MPRLTLHRSLRSVALAATVLLAACAGTPSGPVPAINLAHGVAVQGYDPVAYFVAGKPVEGSAQFTTVWQGATYRFATAQNRDLFMADPAKYAPQYGGFCAFAASNSQIADIDPSDWAVVDGKLYLNNNGVAQSLWALDKEGNIKSGDQFWTGIPKQPVQP